MPPLVHIYPLSRLVHAPATRWEGLLKSIEEGKVRAFSYYLPLREAVVLFCAKNGKGRDPIVDDMVSRARQMGGARGARIAKDNEEAFQAFESSFYPRIRKYKRAFLRASQLECSFEGLTITGAPHFEVVDEDGNDRFVFLHSANWTRDESNAYLELLSIIVQQCLRKPPASIWCMNLSTGKDEKWRSSSRVRSRCVNAARLYGRLISAMQSQP